MRYKMEKVEYQVFTYDEDYSAFRVMTGKYEGAEFIFTTLRLNEENSTEDDSEISVEYFIVKHSDKTPVEGEDFKDVISYVLTDVLETCTVDAVLENTEEEPKEK